MAKFFQKIREAPIQKRRKFSLMTAGLATGIIFLVWITATFSGSHKVSKSIAPFRSLGATVSSSFDGVKSQYESFKQGFSNFVPEAPTTTLESE